MGERLPRRKFLGLATAGITGLSGCSNAKTVEQPDEEEVITENYISPKPDPDEDLCESRSEIESNGPLVNSHNFRKERRCFGQQLDNMEDLTIWAAVEGDLDPDTETHWNGTQSARITVTESEKRAWISRRFDSGIDLSSRDLSLAVHPGTSARSVKVQFLAPDVENSVGVWYPFHKLSGWFRLDCGPTTEQGSPDLSQVRELRISTWAGEGNEVELHIDDLRTVPKADSGAVVLTFDDIYLSQYDNAFPRMREYGFEGVVGTVPWYVGDENRMSVRHLRELQSAGWDIASHPQRKKPLPAYSKSVQRTELRRTKRWLHDHGFEAGSRFLIWPYNEANAVSLDIASRYHYLGFGNGYAPCGARLTDPLTIPRVDGTDASRAKDAVRFAAKYGKIATIMFHSVGDDGRGVSVHAFEQLLDYIDAASVEVVTASEWMTKFLQ